MLELIVPLSCASPVAVCDDTQGYPDFATAWAGPAALAIVVVIVIATVVLGLHRHRSRR